jgi:hypothetical protein
MLPSVAAAESEPSRARRPVAVALAMLAALLLAGGALYWLLFMGIGPGPIEDVAENINRVGATGEMSGSLKSLIGLALLGLALLGLPLVLPLVGLVWLYNGTVDQEEQVYAAWAQVESNHQRRSDLIPNLVQTVQRYLDHERGAPPRCTRSTPRARRRTPWLPRRGRRPTRPRRSNGWRWRRRRSGAASAISSV